MQNVEAEDIARFRRFVERAALCMDSPSPESTDQQVEDLEQFGRFVTRARALATDFALSYLRWFAPRAKRRLAALACPDALQAAGITRSEPAYTGLLAWCLSPANAQYALELQRVFLRRAGMDYSPDSPLRVESQLATSCGTPDIVLIGADRLVVVEAKVDAVEHVVKSTGKPQTISYADLVPPSLGQSSAVNCEVVFLTVDRSEAENGNARRLTWAETAWALAGVVETAVLDEPLRWTLRQVLGHLLRNAGDPRWHDLDEVVHNAEVWHGAGANAVLSHLDKILRVASLIPALEGEA